MFRLVVQGVAPGPRYGHVMGFISQRLVIFGGTNGTNYLIYVFRFGFWIGLFSLLFRFSVASVSVYLRIYTYHIVHP